MDDLYDLLAGGATWDLPSRIPRLPLALVFGAAGIGLLWSAFHPDHLDGSLGVAPVTLGLVALYFAWRALRQWGHGRGR